MARTRILHRCAGARLLHLGPIDELQRGAGQASPPAPWRDVRLRKAIWDVVVGHNPAAIADVLMTLLARVIACNSRKHPSLHVPVSWTRRRFR